MNGTKGFFASKGIWGGLIAIVASAGQILEVAAPVVGPMMGYDITPADTQEAKGYVLSIVGAAGGLLAILGRVRASKKIG